MVDFVVVVGFVYLTCRVGDMVDLVVVVGFVVVGGVGDVCRFCCCSSFMVVDGVRLGDVVDFVVVVGFVGLMGCG